MRNIKLNKLFLTVTIVAIVGFGAYAFADWGMGYGPRGWGHMGPGWHHGWFGNPEYPNELSDEEIAKLNNERQAFFEETSELRESLYQKQLELRAELAKKDPDAKKAVSLQKEISELEGQLSQKRVEQRIKMQKENPELFSGRGYGYGGRGKGYGYGGRGMGRGMGPGFAGRGGACWY
jgi:Spy/CpxP family protein refolding chaperone